MKNSVCLSDSEYVSNEMKVCAFKCWRRTSATNVTVKGEEVYRRDSDDRVVGTNALGTPETTGDKATGD